MKALAAISILALYVGSLGCANMTPTEQRALSGGAMGAAGGAVIGAIAGNAAAGAAVGGAAGVAGGYLYGKAKEAEQSAYERGRREGR